MADRWVVAVKVLTLTLGISNRRNLIQGITQLMAGLGTKWGGEATQKLAIRGR